MHILIVVLLYKTQQSSGYKNTVSKELKTYWDTEKKKKFVRHAYTG